MGAGFGLAGLLSLAHSLLGVHGEVRWVEVGDGRLGRHEVAVGRRDAVVTSPGQHGHELRQRSVRVAQLERPFM